MSQSSASIASSEPIMYAYAIFDGGGVLGAALAGALKAAEDEGIKFVGFGGTSAGSIVAALAAFGHSAAEIEKILTETAFTEYLEDSGKRVEEFRSKVQSIVSRMAGGSLFGRACALLEARSTWKTVCEKFGIDDGRTLTKFLLDQIKKKHPSLADRAEIHFEDLNKPGFPLLKIVASDISRRVPVVFPNDGPSYGNSVLDAVRASTCYPFVFQPVRLKDGSLLVDGGLASNLPAFLFNEEQRRSRLPVFAFDLVSETRPPQGSIGLGEFLQAMISTALDAGDELLRKTSSNIIHVPIRIADEFDVLDFQMNIHKRKELFKIGKDQVKEFLEDLQVFQIAKEARNAPDFLAKMGIEGADRISEKIMRKTIQARFGNEVLFGTVLSGLTREIEASTAARKVRASIMLPTGRKNQRNGKPTRIVVYSHGMIDEAGKPHDDAALEIDEDAGCTGISWIRRSPAFADLEKSKNDSLWKMTREQHDRLPTDRKSMLSVPIWSGPGEETPPQKNSPLGTLSVDSETSLHDTSWREESGDIKREVADIMQRWENVIRGLLLSDGGRR